MIRFIFIIIFFLNASFSMGQNILFDRHYEFGTWTAGWSMVNLQDSAFVVVGSNDSLTVSGDQYSAIISKFDSLGDMVRTDQYDLSDTLFFQTFNANSDDQFKSIVKTPDGNLLAVGLTQSKGAINLFDIDILLVKFNYNLDTLWTKAITHPNDTAFRPSQIINTSDNGFLICGWQNSFTSPNIRAFLCKVDSAGNLIWRKSYSNLLQTSNIFGVVETSDHGFLCTGGVYDLSFEGNPIYFKVDSIGNFQWEETQITLNSDWNRNIIKTLDGNYFINGLGSTGNPTYRQNRFLKITESGVVLWDKSYGIFSTGTPSGILQNADSTYIIAGANGTNGGSQGILMKLDSNGDSLWSRTFGTFQDYGWFWDIANCNDGGYVMCGETYCCNFTPGVGNTSSMWLVRTDSLGLFTGFNELVDADATEIMGSPFPNPTTDYFEVELSIPDKHLPNKGVSGIELLLFDSMGKQIRSQAIPETTKIVRFEMGNVATGTYLVVLSIDGYNAGSRRVVKLK